MQTPAKGTTMPVVLSREVNGHPAGTRVTLDCARSGINGDGDIRVGLLLFGKTDKGEPVILIHNEIVE